MVESQEFVPSRFTRFVRRGVEAIALAMIAAVVIQTFFVSGWLAPLVVSSGSMAPAFLGPHVSSQCPDCGMPLVADAEQALTSGMLDCPHCGRKQVSRSGFVTEGDYLLVNRALAGILAPKRWEPVLFYAPSEGGAVCIKRVVGLPGETIEIKAGDVYVDGHIARKSLAEQLAMAIAVHDSVWQTGNYHQQELTAGLHWAPSGLGWRFNGVWQTVDDGLHRLSFRHDGSNDNARSAGQSPLLDDDAYNPMVSRTLNPVTDLILSVDVVAPRSAIVSLESSYAQEPFVANFRFFEGSAELQRSGTTVAAAAFSKSGSPSHDVRYGLTLSLVDQQAIVAVDNHPILTYPFEPRSGSVGASWRPPAVSVQGSGVSVERIGIWRDVYYTPPPAGAAPKPRRLGPDEYYVLGDNSSISLDSRPWSGDFVVYDWQFIGRPLLRIGADFFR